MVGLAVNGCYEAALVALPREGVFFDAVRNQGARSARAGGEARKTRVDADGRRVLVSHGLPETLRARLLERGYELVPACGGAIAVAPLLSGVRAGLRVAIGTPSISIRGRIGALIAREAGAQVCDQTGQNFPVGLDEPASALLVTADEADQENLLRALDF